MRRAVVVHLCGQGVPENYAGFVEFEAEQPAALAGSIVEAVENEVAEAINLFSSVDHAKNAAN